MVEIKKLDLDAAQTQSSREPCTYPTRLPALNYWLQLYTKDISQK